MGPSHFSDDRIADDLIWELLENANWAPSHKNTEPWRFRVYTQNSKDQLAINLQACYKKHTPEASFSDFKMQKMGKKVLQSSHIIMISLQRNTIVPEWEEIAAVGAAIQNFWLSAEAAGLIGYWSSPKTILDNADDFIELSEAERCLGFFYLGYPKQGDKPPKSKKPIQDKVIWFD